MSYPSAPGEPTGPRGTRAFAPASRGGERRVRTAVSIARCLVDAGLRYRLRELQLLAFPCAVAFLPVFGSSGRSAAIDPLVPAVGLCVAFLGVNAALSFGGSWIDQHLVPLLAMLVASHYALAMASARLDAGASFPVTAALVALYVALGVRLVRLAVPRIKPGRKVVRAPARRWPLWLGTALVVTAVAMVTLAAARTLLD